MGQVAIPPRFPQALDQVPVNAAPRAPMGLSLPARAFNALTGLARSCRYG